MKKAKALFAIGIIVIIVLALIAFATKEKEEVINYEEMTPEEIETIIENKAANLEKIELFEKAMDYKQSSRNYKERKEVRKILKLKENCIIPPDKLLFVDDVITSGNTLLSAYELVKGNVKEIKALVLCDNHLKKEEIKENEKTN